MAASKAAVPPAEIEGQFDKLLASVPSGDESGASDALTPPHLVTLAGLLGVHEDDVVIYIIAWKLGAKKPCKIQREEWVAGMRQMGIPNLDKLKASVPVLRNEIAGTTSFRSFYMFVFEWLRETPAARFVTNEVASTMWPLLLRGRKLPLLDSWLVFVAEVFKKPVSKDLWAQAPDFLATVNIDSYDPSGSWPSAVDDFVDWMKKKRAVTGGS